ncbi:TPM domain-containing protein [Paenibacillus sp. LS1]|uniref:TPM domain-containing protein n=1 Tax=Paenibacillus sp. LS1 TaxID=2992120 RepID=UPI002230C518|nr:TPM domain-containing protein [Paenibacillus sp. LS1]MCW3793970.1 TPM domain-containing protein [Paenibacillus sp. LS1]
MKIKHHGWSKRIGTLVGTFLTALLVMQIFFPLTAAASQVPAKDDRHVYDRGEMFSAGDIPSIEAAIQEAKNLDYYVVTVSSFGDLSGHDYASQLYDSWGLVPSDVLTVLSKNDRRIQMYFRNPELQYKLDQLPANYAGTDYESRSAIDRLVGKNFTPLAKQGKFADGIKALVQETEKISSQDIAETSPPPIVPETSWKNDVAPAQGMTVEDLKQSLRNFFKWVGLIVLGGGCLFVMIKLLMNLHDIQQRNEKLRGKANEVLKISHSAGLRIDLLLKSYDGQRAVEKLSELNKDFTNLKDRVEHLLNGIKKGKVFAPFVFSPRTNSIDATYEEHVKFIGNYELSLKRITEKLEVYEQLGILADESMAKVNLMVHTLTKDIEQISYQQQINLQQLLDTVTHEQSTSEYLHAQARENLEDVSTDLENATQRLQTISNLIQELPELIETVRDLPRVLENKNQELIQQVERVDRKKLDINFDPFTYIHQAMSAMDVLNSKVENGDWKSAKQMLIDIDLILKSDNRLQQRIELFEQVKLSIETLHDHVSNFHFDESRYLSEYVKVKRDYDGETLNLMETSHDYILQQHKHVCNVLRCCELLYSDGRIMELETELKSVFVIIDKIDNLKDTILNQHKHCQTKHEQIKASLASYHDRYTTVFSKLNNDVGVEQLRSSSILDILKRVDDQFIGLSLSLDTYPVSLNQTHESFVQWKEQVEKAINQMDELLYQRKKAKEAIKRTTERFNFTFGLSDGYGRRHTQTHVINTHVRNTKESLNNMNTLWNMGLYAQVLHSCSNAESSLDQLERAQAEAARQEVSRQSQSSSYSSHSSNSSSASSSSYYTNNTPSYDSGSSDSGGSSGGDSW